MQDPIIRNPFITPDSSLEKEKRNENGWSFRVSPENFQGMRFLRNLQKSRYYPVLAGILVFMISAILIEAFFSIKHLQIQSEIRLRSTARGSDLRARVDRELNTLIHLSTGLAAYLRVRHENLDAREIHSILADIQNESPLIRNLGIAIGTRLVFIEPIEGNEKALGMDYQKIPEQWPEIQQTIQSHSGTLAGPVDLVQGGRALIYRYPVFIHGRYWGLLSTVIDTDAFFRASFKDLDRSHFDFAIRTLNSSTSHPEGTILYGDPGLFQDPDTITLRAQIPGAEWVYGIHPRKEIRHPEVLTLFRIAGWLFAFIPGFATAFIFRIRIRLKESESHYRLLAENVSDVIWILNLNREKFTYISPSIYDLRGYTPQEAMNQGIESSLTPESAALVRRDLEAQLKVFLERGKPLAPKTNIHELRQPCKDGRIIWIETATRFRTNQAGEVEVLGVSRNIEDRKRTEEALRQSEKELRNAVATREKMLSIIGHDLRGPIGNFDVLIHELLEDYDELDPGEVRRLLEVLHTSAASAFNLLENLLLWARTREGKLRVVHSHTDLAILSVRTCQTLENQAMTKGVRLINSLSGKTLIAYCDENMMETVLRNLVSNAIKFTSREGTVEVGGNSLKEKGLAEVYVKDTGCGIPEDQLSSILRGETPVTTRGTGGEKGSGLGLTLCREFTEKNGGRLHAESTPDQGTTFRFTLPLERKELKDDGF